MNDDKYHFELTVTEYSSQKKVYEDTFGYQVAFHQYLKQGGEELYDNLLSTIVCNSYDIDYFGNIMDCYTTPEGYTGFQEGVLMEEHCKNGTYKGSFFYHEHENAVPYMMQKAYVIADIEEYKEPAEGDHGYYAQESGCYESIEECEEYARNMLIQDMYCYVPLDTDGYRMDTTQEEDWDLFHEKVSGYRYRMRCISPNRVRFDSVAELADYYVEKMSSGEIDKSNFYDFLLTLVEYEERNYDSEGHLLRSRIRLQELDGNRSYHIVPAFSYETAEGVWNEHQRLKEKLSE